MTSRGSQTPPTPVSIPAASAPPQQHLINSMQVMKVKKGELFPLENKAIRVDPRNNPLTLIIQNDWSIMYAFAHII
jgi:hypothetical protein